jgi:hypothetical protein
VESFPFWSVLKRILTGKLLTGKFPTCKLSTDKVVESYGYGSFEYIMSTTMKSTIPGGE